VCDKVGISYIVNSIYKDNNIDNRKEIFNIILSKVIYILESLKDNNNE
jgi:hypothetical protein